MNLECQRSGLLAACQLVSAAVAARTTKPILCNVKATADGDRLTLVAYDTEVGLRYELRGVVTDVPGAAILAVAQLVQILRESSDETVVIDADDNGCVVKLGSSRYEMPGYPVAEFPDIPEFADAGNYHELTAGALRTAIRRTAFAAEKKDTSARFAMTGVLWEADEKAVRLVATDSKRLAVCEAAVTHFVAPEKSNASHLVPAKSLGLLEKNLTDDGELVRVCLRPNEAMFQTERATIYTRLVEGRFPPHGDIINQSRKQAKNHIALPTGPFLAKIRQAKIATDDESCRVDMTFAPGRVTMQARGAARGSSHVELALPEYGGPEIAVAFDPDYLTEFLKVIDGALTVTLEIGDGSKPVLFTVGDDYRYMVMPLTG